MTRIILVRHAEAQGNAQRMFQGHSNAAISEKGRKQLALLSIRCRNMARDAIYTSPLRRAKETAEAINQFRPVPLYFREGLMEINGGVWENKPWKDLPELYPEEARHWNEEPWAFAPEGGETMTHLYNRIYSAVLQIARENQGKTVFVVSHGCAIRNLLCRLKYNDINRLNDVAWCDNTAISYIDFDEDLRPTLTMESDASHLDETTSTLAHQVWWRPEYRGKKEAWQ
ncbi:MAG: histidine phosphatase family protein [Oscillospiraceae bacterium]|nr:histidine phosphatase family protein [Oscillospiraceae bacterium]